jgi:hypothetical protein
MHKDVLGVIGDMPGNRRAEPKKHGMGTAGKIGIAAAVGIAAFEGAGIAYDAAKYTGDQALPISTMAEHPFGIGLPPKVEIIPSTFNPAAIESVIGPENSVQMTWDQYEATSPTLWNEQNKTMTAPLSIIFENNRIPTLRIEKVEHSGDKLLNKITIGGLQERDIFCSPCDGKIQLTPGSTGLSGFFIHATDPQGRDIILTVATTGLNPLFDIPDRPIGESLYIPIKKGDPIGSLSTSDKHWAFNGQIQIIGHAPSIQNFNLATTPEGKAILITK